jgi:hypothetical protein
MGTFAEIPQCKEQRISDDGTAKANSATGTLRCFRAPAALPLAARVLDGATQDRLYVLRQT